WTAPPRGAPEGGPAVGAVGRAVLHSPPGPRAGSALRRPRSAPAAEDLDRSTPHAPPKSSIHSRAALSGRAGRRGRSTAPCSTAGAFSGAPATKARVFRPEPSPTPTRALYVVTALDGDDDAGGSISKDFVRIPRNEAHADSTCQGESCAPGCACVGDGNGLATCLCIGPKNPAGACIAPTCGAIFCGLGCTCASPGSGTCTCR